MYEKNQEMHRLTSRSKWKYTFDEKKGKKKDLKVPKMQRICMSCVLTRTGVGYVRKENIPI